MPAGKGTMQNARAVFGVIAAGLIAVAAPVVPAQAKFSQAPASRVMLDLPDGYTASRLYSGFVNERAGVSLVIAELPGAAYEQLARGLTADALAGKGIVKAEAGKLARAEPYLYMRGEQASEQGPVAKFLIAFRNEDATALVTANVQKAALDGGHVSAQDVEKILASASLAAEAAPAQDVFKLGYLGPFKPAGSILGTTRAFTLDGKLEPGHQRASLVVAPSLDMRPVTEPDKLPEKLIDGIAWLEDIKITSRRQLEVAGLKAIEITADAKDKESGKPTTLFQTLILGEAGGYYRVFAELPVAQRDALLPELARIAGELRPLP